jgi:hypothetical protein
LRTAWVDWKISARMGGTFSCGIQYGASDHVKLLNWAGTHRAISPAVQEVLFIQQVELRHKNGVTCVTSALTPLPFRQGDPTSGSSLYGVTTKIDAYERTSDATAIFQ